MSTYLIDFENVKSAGLTGIDKIAASDAVHLFWSVRENKISIEMMEMIRKSSSEIVMHKASIGERDALDHQLCSFMGYLAGQNADKEFVIISNDKAYDHLIEFWKELRPDIKMVRVPEILKVSGLAKPLAAEVKTESNPEANQRGRKNNRSKNSRNQKFDKRRSEEVKTETAVESAMVAQTPSEEDNTVQFDGEMIDSLMEIVSELTAEEESATDEVAEAADKTADEASDCQIAEPLESSDQEDLASETEAAKTAEEAEETAEAEEKSSFWSNPEPEEIIPVKKPEKTLVVTGFVSSEVRESGYRADGIMPSMVKEDSTDEEERVAENTVEESIDENTAEITVEEEKAAEDTVEETSTVEITAEEENADESSEAEIPEEKISSAEIPSAEISEEAVSEEALPEQESVIEDSHAEENPADETASEAFVTEESSNPEETSNMDEMPAEEVPAKDAAQEEAAKPEKKKTRNGRGRKTKSQKKEAVQESATEEGIGEASEQPVEKKVKKTRNMKSSKKTVPAEKGPVSAADVISRVAEAKDAEWLDDLVRLINETANRRDMYNQIVKRLGQEHGKSVYYSVKTLK